MKFTSSPWSAISGSIAGTTYYSRNGKLIARARVNPGNPNTTAQQRARSNLAVTASGWNNFTPEERDAWNTYAANSPTTDNLGNTIYFTGQQAYVRWATVRDSIGASIDVTPTSGVYGFGNAPSAVFGDSDTSQEWIVGITDPGASTTGDVVLQRSAVLGPGQDSIYYPLVQDAVGAVIAASTSVIFSAGQTLTDEDRMSVRVRICYDDGRLSMPFREVVTVTDIPGEQRKKFTKPAGKTESKS